MIRQFACPHVSRFGSRALVALLTAVVASAGLSTPAGEPGAAAAARARVVDPAVVPAGGGCTACGPAGCRHGRGGLHGHHPGCREGVCVPYCPVRPQQFGYYGTRWRRWPGQDVVQVSAERATAPVQPPRSEVPGATEESMAPRTLEPPVDAGRLPENPGPAAGPSTEPEPAEPPRRPAPQPEPQPQPEPKPEPTPEPKPAAPDLEPAPAATPTPEPGPAPQPVPEPKPPAKPEPAAEDENLFEVLSGTGWRAKRRFAASASADAAAAGSVEPAAHAAPARARIVPRVDFDPAAETKRLRSTR